MKIIDIKFVKELKPHSMMSTPTPIFHTVCDTGYETDLYFDTWYSPADNIRNIICKEFDYVFTSRTYIDNINEIIDNVIDQLIEHKCIPYTKNEL